MERKNIWLLSLLLVFSMATWGQAPNGSGEYYKPASGKKGQALKTALYGIINKHTNIGYDGLYEAYKKTDTRPDGYVRDWYSCITNYVHVKDKAGSYKKEGDCYNREHSLPQSWFESYGSASIIKADIVHVLPTDGYINNRRSNLPLAEVGTSSGSSAKVYSKWGRCSVSGYSGQVFEPNDEIKGDMARIYFYMVTCYENQVAKWGGGEGSSSPNATATVVFNGSTYQPFNQWYFNMLMKWSRQDPVDALEIERNKAVFSVQGNRNPFVDYPGLEEYVWGSKTNQTFSYNDYDGTTPDNPDTPDTPDTPDNPDNPGTTPSTSLFVKVTTNNELKAGYEYIIVNEAYAKAMGALNGKVMEPVDITITNDGISPNEQVVVVTLGGSSGAWSLKGSEGYLTSPSSKNMAWVTDEAKTWSISNSEDGYTLSSLAGVLQYNPSAPRFTTYTSSQKPAVLYYRNVSESPSGIVSVKRGKKNRGSIYNPRGQKMKGTLPKGVYIRNGRKFVVK